MEAMEAIMSQGLFVIKKNVLQETAQKNFYLPPDLPAAAPSS
jgi:hypothetical protein